MKTLREAAQNLGVDAKTLRKWLERADMAVEMDPLDKRLRMVSDDQLAELARVRGRLALEDGDVDVLARLEAIERRLDVLEARRTVPSPLPALSATPPLPQRVYSPRPRADDTLPAGWIAFSGWARSHGLNGQERTMVRLWQDGRFPAPQTSEEGWRHNGATVKSAYTQEQHLAASRIAAARWPAHFVARSCPLCREADLTADVAADGAEADGAEADAEADT